MVHRLSSVPLSAARRKAFRDGDIQAQELPLPILPFNFFFNHRVASFRIAVGNWLYYAEERSGVY